jgi:hypothetical protein
MLSSCKDSAGGELTQKMRWKPKRVGHRGRCRLRKQIVEPVFGQIKQAHGFRQLLLRDNPNILPLHETGAVSAKRVRKLKL